MVYTEAIYIKPDQDDRSRNGRYVPETLEFDTIDELKVLTGAVQGLEKGSSIEVAVPDGDLPVPVAYPVIGATLAEALKAREEEYREHMAGYKQTHDPQERRLAHETLRIMGDGARMLAPIALRTEGIDVEIVRAPQQDDPEVPFEQAVLTTKPVTAEGAHTRAHRRSRVRTAIAGMFHRLA